MIKRYSFPNKEIATNLIAKLNLKGTVSSEVLGIVELGFQHKYEYNEETQESILVKEATTYDVDVFWSNLPNKDWSNFEVNPKTPNHKFT